MISLLLAPAAVAGEFIIPIVQAPPAMEMQAQMAVQLSELTQMLAAFPSMGVPMRVMRAPTNPCEQDARRLHCNDAACLRRSADDLSPACAALLLGEPEPSPAPDGAPVAAAPRTTRSPVATVTHSASPRSSGFFEMVSSGSDGVVRRVSGTIGGGARSESSLVPPALAAMLPPEIRAMMMQATGEMGEAAAALAALEEEDDEDEVEEVQEAPQHPCAREMEACSRELGARSSSEMEQCLMEHLEELSHHCGCFLRQMTAQRPRAPPAAAAAVVAPAPRVIVIDNVALAGAPAHPLHRLSCFLFFVASVLLAYVLARAFVRAVCGPAPKPTNVVMVPPEASTIKHIKVAVGAKGSKRAAPAPMAPVQVAEPLAKA